MNIGNDSRKVALVATGAAGVLAASYILHHYIRRYLYWNSKFVKAGKIDTLQVFPIKSCKGKQVPYIDCDVKGTRYGENKDRHFLVVDSLHNNMFLTARTYPRMVLIESNVEGNIFTLSNPDGNSVSVNLDDVVRNQDVRPAL
ncbi:mitochondrial amidoxime-reducing component 1 [Ditylenchus destructor]|nr:mitochondrial amidoxime-reducing component 1 [Ditylenchus destructor]